MRPADLVLHTLRIQPSVPPEELRHHWRGVASRALPSLVEYEDCALWLVRRLRDLDVLDALEPGLRLILLLSARRIVARNLRVEAECDAVVRRLTALDVPHVLLKGAARRLVAARYPYADARVIGDVDVLVPLAQAQRAWERLRALGYQCAAEPSRYDGHIHLPPLWTGRRIPIELHTTTSYCLAPADAWHRQTSGARTVPSGGGLALVPSATELFWHALVHAPLRWPRAFSLRFFQDAAVVWAADDQIDWQLVATRLESTEVQHPARARTWLAAAAWLAGRTDIPGPLGTLPPVELSTWLDWRHAVFSTLGRSSGAGMPWVWSPGARSRACRLLIDQGTRRDLRMPRTPAVPRTAGFARVGRFTAAQTARACHALWRACQRPSVRVPRGASGETVQPQADPASPKSRVPSGATRCT